MLERYFKAWKTLRRLRFGPSGPYIDGFATVLERDGYAKAITKHHLRAALRNGEQNESDLALAAGATAANSPLRNLPITQVMVSSPLPAATGIAQNVRARRHADGWPTAKRSCCRCRIFTSSTRCRASCATSPTRTSACSITC